MIGPVIRIGVTLLHMLMPILIWVKPQLMTVCVSLLAGLGYAAQHRILGAVLGTYVSRHVRCIIGGGLGILAFVMLQCLISINMHASLVHIFKLISFAVLFGGVYALYRRAPEPIVKTWTHTLLISYGISSFLFFMLHRWLPDMLPLKGCIQGGLWAALLIWCAGIGARRYAQPLMLSICVLIGGAFAIYESPCDTTSLGVILGASVALLLWRVRSRWFGRSIEGLIMLAFLTTPFICVTAFQPQFVGQYGALSRESSYLHRMHIWHNTSVEIFKKPWLGHGLGSSASFGCQDARDEHCYFEMPLTLPDQSIHVIRAEKLGLHPHNLALQLWLELGLLGALIGGYITLRLWRQIYQHKDLFERACWMGFFVTIMSTFWVNVGAFQTWWWCAILWLVALFYQDRSSKDGF